MNQKKIEEILHHAYFFQWKSSWRGCGKFLRIFQIVQKITQIFTNKQVE
jgi:hypothetical protein